MAAQSSAADVRLTGGGFGASIRKKKYAEVPRLHWADPSVRELLRVGQPVILTGGCPLCLALAHWDVDHMRRAADNHPTWPVHFTPRHVQSVARTYGPGLGKGGVREMTLDSFAESPAEGPFNYYLQALLVWSRGGGGGGGRDEVADGDDATPARELRPNLGPTLERELRTCIDWAWLREASATAGEGAFEACQMWMSLHGRRLHTPCHYDGASNFLCQLRGSKRVRLFAPSQSFRLYPYPVGHPLDNFAMAMADLDGSVNDPRFPAFRAAHGLTGNLSPGDVLFLPKFWWHHVEQLETTGPVHAAPLDASGACSGRPVENLSLNFWLGSGAARLEPHEWLSMRGPTARPRKIEAFWCGELRGGAARVREELEVLLRAVAPPSDAADGGGDDDDALAALVGDEPRAAIRCMHAARMVESGAVTVCGGWQLGGRFLNAVAEGADSEWAPLDSVAARGFASRVRDELTTLLGDPAAAMLLLRMITRDGRLHPGLAPPPPEVYVASERGDITPAEEVARLESEAMQHEAAAAVEVG